MVHLMVLYYRNPGESPNLQPPWKPAFAGNAALAIWYHRAVTGGDGGGDE
jgi:hypothetical protein